MTSDQNATSSRDAGHAVVIGGSIAGLLAARVLAEHFERVTIVERDSFPAMGEHRRGVPQGKQAHALLAGGREAMERLLPGLTADLEAMGAHPGDIGEGLLWHAEGGFFKLRKLGITGMTLSRPLLEGYIRQRVLALPNVEAIEECDALGLVARPDSRVTGLRVLRRRPGSAEEVLSTSLVVDASGRGSRAPAWLEAIGFAAPAEEAPKVGLGAVSRMYRTPAGLPDGLRAIVVLGVPRSPRFAYGFAQEGDRWLVTLGGYFGDHAPLDDQGFIDFARSLPTPEIYDLVSRAEPLTEAVRYNYPHYQWRHYERLGRVPEGFLSIGDALCSFNPSFGQGMTVAAKEAEILRDCLKKGTGDLPRRFYKRATPVVEFAWNLALGTDLRFQRMEGRRSPRLRFENWYVGKLNRAAHHDAVVAGAFMRVGQFLASPATLMRPDIFVRVLLGGRDSRQRTKVGEPSQAPA